MSKHLPVFVPTAVVPEALSEFADDDHIQTHRSAVRALRDHGILVLPKSEVREIMDTLQRLSNTQDALWRELIKELARKKRHDIRKQRSSTEKLLELAMSATDPNVEIRLVLIGRELESTDKSRAQSSAGAHGNIELVRLPNVSVCGAITKAESSEWFAKGTDRKIVAEAFLIPQAERSKNVRIFDPQLFHDMLGANRREPRDHAEWLISTLTRSMSEDSKLELIANVPAKDKNDVLITPDKVRKVLRSKVRDLIKEIDTKLTIELCLVLGAKKQLSDRFIDFSASTTFDVNHNFDRLGKKANDQEGIWQRVKFTRITKEAEIDEFRAVTDGYLSSPGRIEISLTDGLTGAAAYSNSNGPKATSSVASRARK